MPARVVVVHDDPDFGLKVAVALKVSGYEVAMFPDSMTALEALDSAKRVEVLITGPSFAPSKPDGIALARTASMRRPRIRVLFMARSDLVLFTQGMGELLEPPAEVSDIVQAVRRVLPTDPENSD